jgi:hypothetical protein
MKIQGLFGMLGRRKAGQVHCGAAINFLGGSKKMKRPDGRAFALVFDDPDAQTLAGVRSIYDFLSNSGLRTSVGVWPCGPTREMNSYGETCAHIEYRQSLASG